MKRSVITTTTRTRKELMHAVARLRANAVTELDHRAVATIERIAQEIAPK